MRPTATSAEQHRDAVEQAWKAATGRPVTVAVVVGGDGAVGAPLGATGGDEGGSGPSGRPSNTRDVPRSAPAPAVADEGPEANEDIDLDDLVDAPPGTVPTTLDRLAQAFPGAELIEGRHLTWPSAYSPPVQTLIDELGRLPGIGPKSAQRIAFHLLKIPADDVARLARAITDAKARVRFCARCFNVTDSELCSFCSDDRRDHRIVCVVEESRDIVVGRAHRRVPRPLPRAARRDEPARGHRARAAEDPRAPRPHRAGGHRGADHLHQPQHRGRGHGDVPGPPAAPVGVRVTRLASGLPVGGDLEYADELTLGRALEGRTVVNTDT